MIEESDQHIDHQAEHPTDRRLRLSLRQLEVFVATARSGSTRVAAGRIARSQSATSTSLSDLEEALGVKLFDRVGRRLVLNENGRALWPRAASMVDRAMSLQQFSMGEHAVTLRVAASFTIGEYLLPQRMAQWKREHPMSRFQMQIDNTSEVIAAVAGFEVDVGFVEGAQTHPDLDIQPWLTDELVIVAAPSHPLALRQVGLRDLRAALWVLREKGSGTREATDRWLFEKLGRLNVDFELGSTEAIKRLVAAGAGIACLSRYAVAQAIEQGWLVELRTRLPKATRRLVIVTHRDKELGDATAEFVRSCLAP
jgi:DNA-binding transcriptional LysR family regulator